MTFGSSPLGTTAFGSSSNKMAQDVLQVISNSPTPIDDAREIMSALREGSKSNKYTDLEKNKKYSCLKKWIPDTPEKLGAYAAIIAVILHFLLAKVEPKEIKINNIFIQQYEVTIKNNLYFKEFDN